jgi:hypothetical protein
MSQIHVKFIDRDNETFCTLCGKLISFVDGQDYVVVPMGLDDDSGRYVTVCAGCLMVDDIDTHLEQCAATQSKRAQEEAERLLERAKNEVEFLRNLIGRLRLPTSNAWLARVEEYRPAPSKPISLAEALGAPTE